ncbi:MAG TPA: hypothetical protein ENI79_03110 [Rhodospirillales bacterium]|nr:hypothetical protein [Rhodospirillales bacterium]
MEVLPRKTGDLFDLVGGDHAGDAGLRLPPIPRSLAWRVGQFATAQRIDDRRGPCPRKFLQALDAEAGFEVLAIGAGLR